MHPPGVPGGLVVIQLLSVTVPCLYLALAGMCTGAFLAERESRLDRVRLVLLLVALAAHAGLILARFGAVEGVPQLSGWLALSPLALVIVAMFLALGQREKGGLGTGAFVYGLAFLLQLFSSAFGSLEPLPADERPPAFYGLHVASILVASAALALSGVHGLLYLLLFRQMRHRQFGKLFAGLPSLGELARQMRRAALIAFVLLAVGVNGGIWWAHAADIEGFRYSDPLVLILSGLMVHFGLIAFSGSIAAISARRASWAATAGLVLLLVSLAFSLLPSSFHGAP